MSVEYFAKTEMCGAHPNFLSMHREMREQCSFGTYPGKGSQGKMAISSNKKNPCNIAVEYVMFAFILYRVFCSSHLFATPWNPLGVADKISYFNVLEI